MDGASGPSIVPPTSTLDKSRVLDIKPLRTLVPMFPSPPQAPPFVCSSPFGPFPSGFSPFYPFNVPQGVQYTQVQQQQGGGTPSRAPSQDGGLPSPAAAVPLRSFGTPKMGLGVHFAEVSNGDAGSSMNMSGNGYVGVNNKRSSRVHGSEKKTTIVRVPSEVPNKKTSVPGLTLSPTLQEDGSRELVNYVMLKFDAVRRRISQLEDSKEAPSMINRCSHFKSANIMMTAGIRTNLKKRVGVAPGVEIGDIFYFRMEMCIVGLHSQTMAGIDYMILKGGVEEEPIAVSIVSSGGYDDDANDKDILIYTGHGGNFSSKDKGTTDQKLVRGNRALDKSFRRGNEIRVIRGIRDAATPKGKIYVYDGLYSIEDSWIEKGKSGASSFKYKMVRIPGQPSAFAVWQNVQMWKQDITSRSGLILPDLTSGAETIPVSLVNDIDDEKGPPHFTYSSMVRYSKSFNLSQPSFGCNCRKECAAGDLNCSCIRKNGGYFPYTGNGILVSQKALVYECGVSCSCMPNCKNRVLQSGLKVHLEVFKTKDKGWGLRSWDPIRAGAFVCEYAGEVIDKAMFEKDEAGNDEYIFDTGGACDGSFKWNYDPELIDEEAAPDANEEYDVTSRLIVSAKRVGNVARFMNHSCSPNVFWQPIVTEQNGESFVHIGFFAVHHIPPMTELTYDYGLSQYENRRKKCLCGAQKCKGYFG